VLGSPLKVPHARGEWKKKRGPAAQPSRSGLAIPGPRRAGMCDLIGGDYVKIAGDQTVSSIARWDGSVWHPFAFDRHIGMSCNRNRA
jgi:hypothetical protein